MRSGLGSVIVCGMERLLRYRGRAITAADIREIRELIAAHPGASRRKLSERLCERWGWRQGNGALRDMVARGLMLALHRAGHIELPAVRVRLPNPLGVEQMARRRPHPVQVDRTPLCGSLRELGPLSFCQVRRTPQEGLFNWLLESDHYLGYTRAVGEHLKFMVFAGLRPVGLFAWSSAARHLAPRDRYLGWHPQVRQRNIRFLAYNTRFLVPSWVQVPHLASHLLARMTAYSGSNAKSAVMRSRTVVFLKGPEELKSCCA